MPSSFPGMDPYLENPGIWPGFHRWLIMTLAEDLSARLRPRYWVGVEERAYIALPDDHLLVGVPDASVISTSTNPGSSGPTTATLSRGVEVGVPLPETVRERYLEIRKPATRELVTVVEVLSPWNKQSASGREEYLRKREAVLGSGTNLVEIDLLRTGRRMPTLRAVAPYDYGVLVSRGGFASRAVLIPFSVRDPIPEFPVPLRPEEDTEVNLGQLVSLAYDRGGYDLVLDYSTSPVPELAEDDWLWAQSVVARAVKKEQ
jgi:hypothetical protein